MEIEVSVSSVDVEKGLLMLSICVDGECIGEVCGSYYNGAQIDLEALHKICPQGTSVSRSIVSKGKRHINEYLKKHPELHRQ